MALLESIAICRLSSSELRIIFACRFTSKLSYWLIICKFSTLFYLFINNSYHL